MIRQRDGVVVYGARADCEDDSDEEVRVAFDCDYAGHGSWRKRLRSRADVFQTSVLDGMDSFSSCYNNSDSFGAGSRHPRSHRLPARLSSSCS